MGWFRKTGARDALAVTMAGVKLGDRFLSVGVRDPTLIAALATKSGLTGRACAIDADAARAEAGAGEVHAEGALVEVQPAPWDALPYAASSFDVVLIHQRTRSASEVLRVLRGGGRVIVVENVKRTRLDPDALTNSLKDAGFAAVRVLAEAEHTLFVEGIKKSAVGS